MTLTRWVRDEIRTPWRELHGKGKGSRKYLNVMFVEHKNEFEVTLEEFRKFQQQMQDPLVVGTMLHKLSEERASANLVTKEINAKLDRLLSLEERLIKLEARLGQAQAAVPATAAAKEEMLLPEVDEEIVAFVRKSKHATAEDVMKEFEYKGTNAASSRLNRLVREGVLKKMQVGRKVVFMLID